MHRITGKMDSFQQIFNAGGGQGLGVLGHGGKSGHTVAAHGDSIEAHQGDILRDLHSQVENRPHGADGNHIAEGEDRRGAWIFLQQLFGGGVTVSH